jgi:hypothetical protein
MFRTRLFQLELLRLLMHRKLYSKRATYFVSMRKIRKG